MDFAESTATKWVEEDGTNCKKEMGWRGAMKPDGQAPAWMTARAPGGSLLLAVLDWDSCGSLARQNGIQVAGYIDTRHVGHRQQVFVSVNIEGEEVEETVPG